jgi:O-antigen/teichoic acid export membrane protein
MGVGGALAGLLIGAVAALPVRLWTVRHMLRPIFVWARLRELLAYGIPLVPASVAYWVFASSDRFVLARMSTLDQLGIYAVANSASSVLGMVQGALGQAWIPHLVQVYEVQRAATPVFLGRMLTYLLIGFGVLCVGLTAFSHELLVILSTPPYYGAEWAIGPLALGFLAYASTNVTAAGINLEKQTRYLAVVSGLAALLNLVHNIWRVPIWGMLASAWATTLAYVFLTLAFLAISQRLLPVAFEARRSLVTLALTVAFTVGAPFLPRFGLLLGLAMKTGYCLAFAGLLVAFRVLDARELGILQVLVASARYRLARRGGRGPGAGTDADATPESGDTSESGDSGEPGDTGDRA